jgi:hypothetical protein
MMQNIHVTLININYYEGLNYYIKIIIIQNFIKLDLRIGLNVLILTNIIIKSHNNVYVLDQTIS